MANKSKLKEAFDCDSEFGAFYTGGLIALTNDGERLLCQDVNHINVVSLSDNKIIQEIGADDKNDQEDPISTFALSWDNQTIVTAHKTGLIKLWLLSDGKCIKMWKASHKGPIARLAFSRDNQVIASGGSDGLVRLWDFSKNTCNGNLKGIQGVISVLNFHPDVSRQMIVAAGDDNKVFCWDVKTRKEIHVLAGHFSKITSVAFSDEFLVTSSRDKVIILWSLTTGTQVRTIPAYESIEGVVTLPIGLQLPNGFTLNGEHIYVAAAGENGVTCVWEMDTSKLVYKQENSLISKADEEGSLAVVQVLLNERHNQLGLVSADHNIMIHDLSTFECRKQCIGFSDDILDIVFMGKRTQKYLAVATNSKDIKVYDSETMNCQVIKGHTDIVLALASHNNLLLSAGKDNSVKLWELDEDLFTVKCLASGTKHTSSIGSVSFGHLSAEFFVSVAQDMCLKSWTIPSGEKSDQIQTLFCSATQIVHDKDVNCVAISPNDKIIATASQDKTAKLWNASDLSLTGVLRGHRRGVWSVRFSPVDQIVLTSSADCTMRLWSLSDTTCLKTFEGHESSVLKAEFICNGLQLLSAGGDGLIKLWSIKSSECVATMDKHESRIWAFAISQDESIVYSGGSDSKLIKWKDVTEQKRQDDFEQKREQTLQEQELNNLLENKKFLKALRLSLQLERPMTSLKIINNVIKHNIDGLDETVQKLSDVHKEALLNHTVIWNANSRNCRPAQMVLNILLQEILVGKLKPTSLNQTVEKTLPYTDRHFRRLTKQLKDLKFLEYTYKCMQPHFN